MLILLAELIFSQICKLAVLKSQVHGLIPGTLLFLPIIVVDLNYYFLAVAGFLIITYFFKSLPQVLCKNFV